jgi:hypothetical protein
MTKLPLLGVLFAVAACSTQKAPQQLSLVQGALVSSTFPGGPTGVQATNEQGTAVQVLLSANAAFRLSLLRGHTYRLSVVDAKTATPILFPRAGGTLDNSFHVSGGGAIVDLGSVRYLASAPAGGFTVMGGTSGGTVSTMSVGTTSTAPPAECVDGTVQGTSQACADDDAVEQCGDVSSDGECENGVDTTTGAACTDPPEPTSGTSNDSSSGAVDPNAPMAVPDHNAPADIGGCDGSDGEAED